MSVQISYPNQFLLGIMFLVVIFAVIEIPAQIFDYYSPHCGLVFNPVYEDFSYDFKKQICDNFLNRVEYVDPETNLTTFEPNQHHSTLNINAEGFRGPEISKEKPDDVYRIFIVGGSTVFSVRAPSDHDTIPGYLQENFNELNLNKKIEVINTGNPGISSADELHLTKVKLVKYNPDLIIVYDGINDIKSPYGYTKPKIPANVMDNVYKKYFSFYKTPKVLRNEILSDSFNFLEEEKENLYKPNTWDKEFGSNAALWKENLSEICHLGKEQGFKTIVILQPFLGTGNRTLSNWEQNVYEKIPPQWYQEAQFFQSNVNDLKDECVIASDFTRVFDGVNDRIYFDRMHISHNYNQVVADEIFELALPVVINQAS